MATKRAITGWSWEDEPDSVRPTEEEAVEDFMYWNYEGETEVTLYGFAPVEPTPEEMDDIAEEVGYLVMELLDDRFGGGAPGLPDTPDAVRDAARTFVREAVKHFDVTVLEVVTEKTVPLTAHQPTGEGESDG